jgi:hypothetical protein
MPIVSVAPVDEAQQRIRAATQIANLVLDGRLTPADGLTAQLRLLNRAAQHLRTVTA